MLSLMSSLFVELLQPLVQVCLEGIDGSVKLLSECHLVEFVKLCPMEAFTNSIGLGMAGFGASMFDATGRQEELVGGCQDFGVWTQAAC